MKTEEKPKITSYTNTELGIKISECYDFLSQLKEDKEFIVKKYHKMLKRSWVNPIKFCKIKAEIYKFDKLIKLIEEYKDVLKEENRKRLFY